MTNHLKCVVQTVSTSTTYENSSVTWGYNSIHYQQLCEWCLKLSKNVFLPKISIFMADFDSIIFRGNNLFLQNKCYQEVCYCHKEGYLSF